MFEWVGRQALSLSPHINVTGLSDTCLQLSLGTGTTLNVHLIPMASLAEESEGADTESTVLAPRTPDHQHMRILPNEGSLSVCLQQAYQHFLNGRQDQASAKETGKVKDVQSEAAGLVKHVSAVMQHRVACDRIISVLEKQVSTSDISYANDRFLLKRMTLHLLPGQVHNILLRIRFVKVVGSSPMIVLLSSRVTKMRM